MDEVGWVGWGTGYETQVIPKRIVTRSPIFQHIFWHILWSLNGNEWYIIMIYIYMMIRCFVWSGPWWNCGDTRWRSSKTESESSRSVGPFLARIPLKKKNKIHNTKRVLEYWNILKADRFGIFMVHLSRFTDVVRMQWKSQERLKRYTCTSKGATIVSSGSPGSSKDHYL
jgi:hypothetical protein